jgi:hypothetical protein
MVTALAKSPLDVAAMATVTKASGSLTVMNPRSFHLIGITPGQDHDRGNGPFSGVDSSSSRVNLASQ